MWGIPMWPPTPCGLQGLGGHFEDGTLRLGSHLLFGLQDHGRAQGVHLGRAFDPLDQGLHPVLPAWAWEAVSATCLAVRALVVVAWWSCPLDTVRSSEPSSSSAGGFLVVVPRDRALEPARLPGRVLWQWLFAQGRLASPGLQDGSACCWSISRTFVLLPASAVGQG